MIYNLYKFFSYLLFPFLWMLLIYRIVRGKEDLTLGFQKLGIYNKKSKQRNGAQPKVAWIHAASVGEINSVIPLIELLVHDYEVLITSVTLSSYQRVFIQRLAKMKNVQHSFAPFDCPLIVSKFLKHYKPNIGIFVDSELWPNLIIESAKKMPLLNINARISDRSYRRWSNYSLDFAKQIYSKFYRIYTASDDDKAKISSFVRNPSIVKSEGNLKFSIPPLPVDEALLAKYQHLLKDKFVIVASSTHFGEEEILLKAIAPILQENADVILIIVPRNAKRGGQIMEVCKSFSINASVRSANQEPTCACYIADTIGELGIWYRLSKVAIIGGSFINWGGHNIIEAAKLDNALITGKYYQNFKDIVEQFSEDESILIADDENDLQVMLQDLIKDFNWLQSMQASAINSANCVSPLAKIYDCIKEKI